MAPSMSSGIFALFLAFALVASEVQPTGAIRVVAHQDASKPEAAAEDQHASEKAATPSPVGQLPGFPFPFFPMPGGAAPAAGGQVPGFPFPLFPLPGLPFPLFPLPGGAQPAGQAPGLPFPLFPPLFPLPGGAPAAGGGQAPGFPFPLFPPLFPLPGAPAAAGGQFPELPFPLFPLPGFPPVHPQPTSPAGSPPPTPSAPSASPATSATLPPTPPSPPVSLPPPKTSSPTAPSQVKDCLPPLMGLTPCMDYLTNTGAGAASTPPSTCCDSFRTLVNDVPICLCHGLNGDINKIMPAPLDFARMMSLPATCRVALPMQTLSQCSTGAVPPLSMPAPAPASPTTPDSSSP